MPCDYLTKNTQVLYLGLTLLSIIRALYWRWLLSVIFFDKYKIISNCIIVSDIERVRVPMEGMGLNIDAWGVCGQ